MRRALVIDANILIRAVLGTRTRRLLEACCEQVAFFVPTTAIDEAQEHLVELVVKRGGNAEQAIRLLATLTELTELVPPASYGEFRQEASELLKNRDPDDWPVLAAALSLGCPI